MYKNINELIKSKQTTNVSTPKYTGGKVNSIYDLFPEQKPVTPIIAQPTEKKGNIFSDISKAIGYTAVDMSQMAAQALKKAGTFTSPADKLSELIYGERYKKQKEKSQQQIGSFFDKYINKSTTSKQILEENIKSKPIKYLTPTLSSAINTSLLAAAGPVGNIANFASQSQQYYDEARAKGQTHEQASATSDIKGAISTILDYAGSKIELKAIKGISKLKNPITKVLADIGISSATEGATEALTEPLTEAANILTGTAKWDNIGERIWQSFIGGALAGGILTGTGKVANSISNINTKIDNKQPLTTKDIQTLIEAQIESDKKEGTTYIKDATTKALIAQGIPIGNIKDKISQPIAEYTTMPVEEEYYYRGQKNPGAEISLNDNNVSQLNTEGGIFFSSGKDAAKAYGENIIKIKKTPENTVTVSESDKLQEMATKQVMKDLDEGVESNPILDQMALGRLKSFAEYTGKPFVETGEGKGKVKEVVYYKQFDKTPNIEIEKPIKSIPEQIISNKIVSQGDTMPVETISQPQTTTTIPQQEKTIIEQPSALEQIKQTKIEQIGLPYNAKNIIKINNDIFNKQTDYTNKQIKDIQVLKDVEIFNEKIHNEKIRFEQLNYDITKPEFKENYTQLNPIEEQSKIKEFITKQRTNFMNKSLPINQAADKSGYTRLKSVYDGYLGLTTKIENSFEGKSQTKFENGEFKSVGKSFNEIVKPITTNGEIDSDFIMYYIAKFNQYNISNGKKSIQGLTKEKTNEIIKNYEATNQKGVEIAKELTTFNKNTFQNAIENKIVDKNLEYLTDKNPYYIFSGDLDTKQYNKKAKTINVQNIIGISEGGQELQTMVDNFKERFKLREAKSKRAIYLNYLGKNLAKIYPVVDIKTKNNEMLQQINGKNYLTIYNESSKTGNIEKKAVEIPNQIYDSLMLNDYSNESWTAKKIATGVQALKGIYTKYNPFFTGKNFVRDNQDLFINSKHLRETISSYPQASTELFQGKGEYFDEFINNGGAVNTFGDYGVDTSAGPIKKGLEKMAKLNEITELSPRFAEYIASRKLGNSIEQSVYDAAEVTVNFKAGGKVSQKFDRYGAIFLNANLKGLDKVITTFSPSQSKKMFGKVLIKSALFGIVPAIFNDLVYEDDEEYQDIPRDIKDNFYLFKLGNGKFFKIPKGRVLSVIGAAARRTLEAIKGDDEAFKGYLKNTYSQLGPSNPITSSAFSPLAQVVFNKDAFGNELVSSSLLNKPTAEQFNEKTDEASKILGSIIGISPIKINHLIKSYSGFVGDITLPLLTKAQEQNVLEKNFLVDTTFKNKSTSDFYDRYDKYSKLANSEKSTLKDKAIYKYYTLNKSVLDKLYAEKREVLLSDIPNSEKVLEQKRIQTEINKALKEITTNDTFKEFGENFASIGNRELYLSTDKNQKQTWTEVTPEQKIKNKNISLQTFANYQQQLDIEKNNQLANGILTENGQLKQDDKINILLNNVTDNTEKSEIYKNYIMSSEDAFTPYVLNTGIDINELLNYKLQEFKSEYKDDGTLTGKVISGTKKTDIFNYVNSMNISYNQRLLILGNLYSLSNKEQSDLANYVLETYPNQYDRIEIFKKLKGYKVYQDGSVTW